MINFVPEQDLFWFLYNSIRYRFFCMTFKAFRQFFHGKNEYRKGEVCFQRLQPAVFTELAAY